MPLAHHAFGGAAGGRAAADQPLDVVFRHKVHRPLAGAHHRLPSFHRQRPGARHQRDFLERITAVRHFRRNPVILAFVRERILVKGFHNDFHLFLEHFPVFLVAGERAGNAESVHFPGMVAAAHAENHPPAGQNIGGGVILRQPQRMPHRVDVEPAPELELLGQVRQMHIQQQQVGDAFIPLPLEVMLRRPESVVAQLLHFQHDGLGLAEHPGQLAVGQPPLVDRRTLQPDVVQIHVPGEKTSEFRNQNAPPANPA